MTYVLHPEYHDASPPTHQIVSYKGKNIWLLFLHLGHRRRAAFAQQGPSKQSSVSVHQGSVLIEIQNIAREPEGEKIVNNSPIHSIGNEGSYLLVTKDFLDVLGLDALSNYQTVLD